MKSLPIAVAALFAIAPAIHADPISPARSARDASHGASTSDDPVQRRAGATRYIVQLEAPPAALYDGGVPGLAPTSPRATGERRLDADGEAARAYVGHLKAVQDSVLNAIAQRIGRTPQPVFRYSWASNGLALDLTADEAIAVAGAAGVLRVEPEEIQQLHTDYGPGWIGAPLIWNPPNSGLPSQGEGIVVGIIDTGLTLDHPSFAAVGGDGYVHNNPNGAGNYLGL
ncbi:MAG: hypothetical protein AB1Z65_19020, partial [Candidatus Sulfomarinibacteraceae bacterium]